MVTARGDWSEDGVNVVTHGPGGRPAAMRVPSGAFDVSNASIATLSVDPTLDRLLSALSATFFAFSGLFCFCALVLGLADNLEAGAVFGIASVGSIIVVVGVAFVRVVFCWPKLRTELAVASPYWNTRRARVQSSTHPGALPSTDAVDRMAAVVDRVLAVITMAPSPRVGDRSTAAAPAPAAEELAEEGQLAADGGASHVRAAPAARRDGDRDVEHARVSAIGEQETSVGAPPMRSASDEVHEASA